MRMEVHSNFRVQHVEGWCETRRRQGAAKCSKVQQSAAKCSKVQHTVQQSAAHCAAKCSTLCSTLCSAARHNPGWLTHHPPRRKQKKKVVISTNQCSNCTLCSTLRSKTQSLAIAPPSGCRLFFCIFIYK